MSKALIKAKLEPEGLYRVQIALDVDVSDEITRLQNLITWCDTNIADLQDAIDNCVEPDCTAADKAIYQQKKANYELQSAGYQKQIKKLEAFLTLTPIDVFAWLADYPVEEHEPKAGELVGIIDLDREFGGDNRNIQPCWLDNHKYLPDRDGRMTPVGVINPFHAYYNTAIIPALQKYKPRYRHGVAYNIDKVEHTCSVRLWNLDAQKSPVDSTYMSVNLLEQLHGVPIQYQDCHSAPFEDSDEVLVEFTENDWSQPVVKGFKTNPKPCETDELVYVRLGALGFVWDTKTDTYHEDLPGIQSYSACESFLGSRAETTLDTDYYGLPYQRLLMQMYEDAGYTIHALSMVTWGLPEHGGLPGYLWRAPYTFSETATDLGYGGTRFEQTYAYADTTCPWGTIRPARELRRKYDRYWDMIINGEYTFIEEFSTNWWLWSYVCPWDHDLSYYSFGTGAEYGNEPFGTGYPGCVMSEKTIAQVIFASYISGKAVQIGASFDYVKTIDGPRTTVTHCTCGAYPWDVGGTTESNPQLMPRNDLFSEACNDLIDAFYVSIGYDAFNVIGYSGTSSDRKICGDASLRESDDGQYIYSSGGNSACNVNCVGYWFDLRKPKFSVKIFARN